MELERSYGKGGLIGGADQANIGSHTFEKSIAFADFDYELFTLPEFNSKSP